MTLAVLAIDQGTTGSTCLVISREGAVLGRGYREITQHYPRPGWVEHDPAEIFRKTVDAGREAVAQAGVIPDAIGITNQRETVLLWERGQLGSAALYVLASVVLSLLGLFAGLLLVRYAA